jgi:hypothetical protein
VPLARKDGSDPRLWVLDGNDGRLRSTVEGLTSVRVADLDGDGVPDLVGVYRPERGAEGWLSAIPGRPAAQAPAERLPSDDDLRQGRPLPWTGVEYNPTELLALTGLVGFALCLVALPLARRGPTARSRFRVALLAVTAAAWLPALLCLAARKWTMPALADFGTLLPILALPAAVPLALALQAAATRRWWACVGTLAVLALFTMLTGAALLALDLRRLSPGENYSLRGWFFLPYFGAYAAGMVLGPLALMRSGSRSAAAGPKTA